MLASRVSSIGPRPADEERFKEFKARRLAKKESDRLKLTAEFPLLFANKPVGNKVTNTNTVLNKKVTITPSKRKSTFEDKNDENKGSVANKLVAKPTQTSKTPLSSKKQRKGSMLSPKPQSMQATTNLSSTLPARLQPVAPLEIVKRDLDPAAVVVDSPVSSGHSAFCVTEGQSGVEMLEMAPPVRKPLFQDDELEQTTSSRSSLSSLGESIVADFAASGEGNAEEVAVQEQVMDVLDYLLELDEVDEQTYRRMSSQAFSAKTLKRLSMTMKAPASGAAVTGEVTTQAEGAEANNEGDVPLETAYPSQQEDCVIGELDVLNALRNYLSCAVNQQPPVEEDNNTAAAAMDECATEPVEAAEPAEYQSLALSEGSARMSTSSARSSISSAGSVSDRPQWNDAASACGSDRSSLDTTTSCSTMRVSFSNSASTRRQSSLLQPALSQTEEKTTSEETPLVEAVVAPAPVPVEAAPVAPVPAPAPAAAKTVMTYPLAELLDDALMRGLVVAGISRRLDMGNHTKYIVETQILSVPGYAEENSRVRLMCMKRYSDFKALRATLLEVVETRRRLDARSSLSGSRSSMEGSSGSQDILSKARSRRSSVDPYDKTRDSLLFNARDSLCADAEAEEAGGMRCGRPSELIPPLPSRQVMSMSCASLQSEESFQITREAFLKHWLESVFGRQSCESDEYRLELRKFLTA